MEFWTSFIFYGMYWRGPGLWFFLFDLLLMRMSSILSKKKKKKDYECL
jgi:hypothetical protein